MKAALSRAGWLLEVSDRAIEGAREALHIIEVDQLNADEAVLKICAEFASDVIAELDSSGSNPGLDGLIGGGAGPVAKLNRAIARTYFARAARTVVNGTSGANVMLGGLVLPILRGAGCRVLCDRDAHLSVIGGLVVSGAEVTWLWRDYMPEHDVQAPLTAAAVEAELQADPAIRAVFITSPTYDGFDADIEGISEACRRYDALLFVDGAWGAGYGALTKAGFPRSPIERGADVAVVSIHKKGLAPSQIGVALFRDPSHAELFDIAGNVGFSTTSPNYVLLMAAETQIAALLDGELDDLWAAAVADARKIAEHLPSAHAAYRTVSAEAVGARSGDPGHLLIHVAGAGVNGYELKDALGRYGIIAEKATRDTLLVLVGPGEKGQAERHIEALRAATDDVIRSHDGTDGGSNVSLIRPIIRTPAALTLREALLADSTLVGLDDAVGKICAAPVAVYPPGSAILMPGERVQAEHIEYLRAVHRHGGRVRGLDMAPAPVLRVCRGEV